MDQKTDHTHCRNQQGHLRAVVLAPTPGTREVPTITEEVAAALDAMGESARGRCFILDLSQVRSLTSLGLGMCVNLRNRAEHAGMRPVLFGASSELLELLRLMRLDRLFTLAADQRGLERLLA
jgi:anti-anti-sigma factor